MLQIVLIQNRISPVCAMLCALLASTMGFADEVSESTVSWSLRDAFPSGTSRDDPSTERNDEQVWHWLRTTSSEGPVESRRWLRDGKYVPLAEQAVNLFDSPVDGWAYQIEPPLAPLIGKVTSDYDIGRKFRPGEVLIAPGPDYAVVIGWQSPVSGTLEIEGVFEHAQTCCGVNAQVAWHVERGSFPSEHHGFSSFSLASGTSKFDASNQLSRFHITDQPVQPGDFVYFIVDAVADGTGTPHHGDATRIDVTLTVRDASWPPPPTYETVVRPILARACFDCHGQDQREAELDLRTLSELLRGGENGPAMVPGEPHNSLMIDLVARGEMPPGDSDKLTARELDLLRRWIKAGAPADELVVALPPHSQLTEQDRSYWAFQPPRKTPPPSVRLQDRVRTPIDAFLLAKLEENGLTFSQEADRSVLIRRAYLDLTGLPPLPSAVQAFVEDPRPNAYEVLIDTLLHSARYGERWGRHWLDASGYVDGKLDNDLGTIYPNDGIWRYRDYVIAAFNDDMPFDQFLKEQIAGDEMVDWRSVESFDARTISLLIATGFLRNVDDHTDFAQYGIQKRYEVINETLDMFSTAILGMTLECCRCHNHKYDPLPQRDYYRLMACFEPAYNVDAWKPPKDRYLADVSPSRRATIDQRNQEIDQQVAELTKAESTTRQQVRDRLMESRLARIPEVIRADVKQAVEVAPDKRSEAQKALAADHEAVLKINDADIDAALTEVEKESLQSSSKQRADLLSQKETYGIIQALWDVGTPPISHVHRRGDVFARGVLVQPGFPEILQASPTTIGANVEAAQGQTSGRRLALAQWLTRPDHPLTARVFVNRLWHHHFGRGIVETIGNFGRSGSPPTHPELLDWLAVDFVEQGWSIKRLHRQIMLSTAYRQSSRNPIAGKDQSNALAAGQDVDPENRLLWRMNLRRLEAEIVRDSILAASGSLDPMAGGPPVEITSPPDGLSQPKSDPTTSSANRRSVYLFARRVYPLKFMEIFDAPIMPVNCTQRMNSATVLQSLALMNSEFLFAQAEQMGARLIDSVGPETADQVKLAFQLALARQPTDSELASSLSFIQQQARGYRSADASLEKANRMAMADVCHMLLASNEFLYVE